MRARILGLAVISMLLATLAPAQELTRPAEVTRPTATKVTRGRILLGLSVVNNASFKQKNLNYEYPSIVEMPRGVDFTVRLDGRTSNVGHLGFQVYQLLAGPKITRHKGRFGLSAQAKAGATRIRSDGFAIMDGQSPVAYRAITESGPAIGLGCGLDVRLNDRVALRTLEVTMVSSRIFGGWSNDLQTKFGVTIRFGR